jgi:hypothetical protein
LWGRLVPGPTGEKTANLTVDVSIERRVGWSSDGGGRAIRVQMGTGRGRGPGFEYNRVMIGTIRHLGRSRDHSDTQYAVFIAAGGGAHIVAAGDLSGTLVGGGRSPSEGTRPSLFGGLGADGWVFGSRRATLRGEYQLFSIGRRIYGSLGIGVQFHFR